MTNLLHILAVGPLARLLDQSVYCALNCLWRLSECPDERAAHPFVISETVLAGDFFGGEVAGFHHQPRGFDAQAFEEQCSKLLEIAQKCPVHRMLVTEIDIRTRVFSPYRTRCPNLSLRAPNISRERSAFPSVRSDRRNCPSSCVWAALFFPAELYGTESYLIGGKYN